MQTLAKYELLMINGGGRLETCIGCAVGVTGLVASIGSLFTPAAPVTAWWAIGHIAAVVGTGLGCAACIG